jgi:type III secretory pathway component EscU
MRENVIILNAKKPRATSSIQHINFKNTNFNILFLGNKKCVGLIFIMGKIDTPIVKYKCEGKALKDAISFAEYHKIPIHKDTKVTNTIYKKIDINNQISHDLFQPVAIALHCANILKLADNDK